MGDEEAGRVLGRLEARVAAIEDRLERQELNAAARMAAIELKLDGVANVLAQSMGAMKVVHWMSGAAVAALGFVVSWLMRSGK